MLPGFRFLFAAMTLAVSLLVFGLGAAALLRAAHEQFVNVHTVRPPAITLLARAPEAPTPSLSMLRVDSPAPPAPAAEPPAPAATANQSPNTTDPVAADVAALGNGEGAKPEAKAAEPAQTAALQPSGAETPATAPAAQSPQAEQAPAAPEPASQASSPPPAAAPEAVAPAARPAATAATSTDAPKPDDKPQAGAEKVVTPAAPTQTAATETAAPATPAAPVATAPSAEALPEVAPLSGPIPTPRRDPRDRSKTAANTPAAPSAATPAAPAADTPTTDVTGSIGETLPPPDATPLPVARPKPMVRRPLKKRRQVARRRTPRAEQPQSGSGVGL
ncbi:conserved hypothetical protein, conserved [Rhodopseudomonas palustris TIE-1]|uniref:hypothetical protein n=1 Tax=Rhodopseudomonas palustris TaxID=1076 RepID=UPI00017797B9|nr:hypothetical protein [Rhodopseudomonas palustris]ACF02628.1 conserved hypothetical protein, conserved [Rhodopseudomonas palustris TIE-1]